MDGGHFDLAMGRISDAYLDGFMVLHASHSVTH
jgi:hypothetical protein